MEYTQERLQELSDIATQVRRDAIRMTHNCGSGHPGGAMGCADYFVALYFEVMKNDPSNFTLDGKGEDIFFLSNGHICAGLYSTLARRGYFPVSELNTHRMINSRLQGHPATAKNLEGVRIASGSLGQGLSVAVGAALSKKQNNEDRNIFVLMGDGELQEGQIWEAAMYASHNKVDNLIAAVDVNNAQIDGLVENILDLGDLKAKWEAFGWAVLECADGNDMAQVLQSISQAKELSGSGKPVVILLKTVMGYGVDFMATAGNAWHGKATNEEQTAEAMKQLVTPLEDF